MTPAERALSSAIRQDAARPQAVRRAPSARPRPAITGQARRAARRKAGSLISSRPALRGFFELQERRAQEAAEAAELCLLLGYPPEVARLLVSVAFCLDAHEQRGLADRCRSRPPCLGR